MSLDLPRDGDCLSHASHVSRHIRGAFAFGEAGFSRTMHGSTRRTFHTRDTWNTTNWTGTPPAMDTESRSTDWR